MRGCYYYLLAELSQVLLTVTFSGWLVHSYMISYLCIYTDRVKLGTWPCTNGNQTRVYPDIHWCVIKLLFRHSSRHYCTTLGNNGYVESLIIATTQWTCVQWSRVQSGPMALCTVSERGFAEPHPLLPGLQEGEGGSRHQQQWRRSKVLHTGDEDQWGDKRVLIKLWQGLQIVDFTASLFWSRVWEGGSTHSSVKIRMCFPLMCSINK